MPSSSRRALLRTLGVVAGGLAGCQNQPETTPTDANGPTQTRTPTSPPAERASPTETDTPTAIPHWCAPAPRPETPWPLRNRSAANDNYVEGGTVFERAPSVAWTARSTVPPDNDAHEATFFQPVVTENWLYTVNELVVGTEEDDPGGHSLQGRDPATGQLRWPYTLPRAPTAPAVQGETILVGSRNSLHAVDRREGSKQWIRDFEAPVDAVIPAPERIYVVLSGSSDRDSEVHALAHDGTTEWSRTFGRGVTEPPAIAPDYVYVGTPGGTVYALSRSHGHTVWTASTPRDGADDRDLPPSVDSVVATTCAVFVVTDGDVYAFDADGQFRWHAEGGYRKLATDGTYLFGGSSEGHSGRFLRAFDAATGTIRWAQPFEVRRREHSVLTSDVLYVPVESELIAVDRDDGEERWRTTHEIQDLVLADDALYGIEREHVGNDTLVAMRGAGDVRS